ncbi:MAG: two-component regulator propeller domain-containing protein, partial [Pseudomonadota bacterium]
KITQDALGYLWFGSDDFGVFRYDGYSFTSFQHKANNEQSLWDNHVSSLLGDSRGRLWVGTQRGLSIYRRGSDDFERIPNNWLHGLPDSSINNIFEDKQKRIWVATDYGLHRFSEQGQRFEHFQPDSLAQGERFVIQSLLIASKNTLWVGAESGLYSFNTQTLRFKTLPIALKPNNKITVIASWDDNHIWIGTKKGLYRYDIKVGHLKFFENLDESSSVVVNDIVFDLQGNIWIATIDGLYRFQQKNQYWEKFKTEPLDKNSLSSSQVLSLFFDHNMFLWIGTNNGGANQWNPNTEKFSHYLSLSDLKHTHLGNQVTGLQFDKFDNLWVSTQESGLYFLQRNNLVEGTSIDWKSYTVAEKPSQGENFPLSNHLSAVYEDKHGNIWIGYFHTNFISYFNPYTNVIKHLTIPLIENVNYEDFETLVFHEDRAGQLWVGTKIGLFKVIDDKSLQKFPLPESYNQLSKEVGTLYTDFQNRLWVGGLAGLLQLSSEGKVINHFKHELNNPLSLSHNHVTDILQDDRGMLWVATRNGLNCLSLNKSTMEFKTIKMRHSSSNDQILSMIKGQKNTLWLITAANIEKFFISQGTSEVFDKNDGILSQHFYPKAVDIRFDETIFIGGSNGIDAFNPNTLNRGVYKPNIVVNQVILNDKKVINIYGSSYGYPLLLEDNDNQLLVEMAVIDYHSSHNNRYRYRVIGLNDTWVDLGNNRKISLMNLDVGRYQLQMVGANRYDQWSENIVNLNIHVKQSFWQSVWIKLFAWMTFLSVLILLFYRQYYRFNYRYHWLEKKLDNEKISHKKIFQENQENKVKVVELQKLLDETQGDLVLIKKKYKDMQMLDKLTGVKSKQFMTNTLPKDLSIVNHLNQDKAQAAPSKQSDKVMQGIFLVDIDGFHFVNEHYGFACGDHLLKQFADVLRTACRGTDIIGRWVGQQFIVSARFESIDEMCHLAERIRRLVAARSFDIGNGAKTDLTCSIGFAVHPFFALYNEALTWEQLIDLADQALYAAKKTSRNAWIGLRGEATGRERRILSHLDKDIEEFVNKGDIKVFSSLSSNAQIVWGIANENKDLLHENHK